jgi:hypothetical protein
MSLSQTTGFVQSLLRLFGLGRAGFQCLMSTSADFESEPSVSWLYRTTEPPNRQQAQAKTEGEGE